MKTFKTLLSESKKPSKKGMSDSAKDVADAIMDEMVYRVKDYFGDWPEDVVGSDMANHFYKVLYREIGKNVREKGKRYK